MPYRDFTATVLKWIGVNRDPLMKDNGWHELVVVETDWITGLKQMSDVKFQRGVYGADLKAMKQEQVQAWMNEYFSAQVQVFDDQDYDGNTDDIPKLYRTLTHVQAHIYVSVVLFTALVLTLTTSAILTSAVIAIGCVLLLYSFRPLLAVLISLCVSVLVISTMGVSGFWDTSRSELPLLEWAVPALKVAASYMLPSVLFLCALFILILHVILPSDRGGQRLWPGFLEVRLMSFTRMKFRNVDDDVRSMIDIFISVFEYNLRTFIRLKRLIQFLFSIVVAFVAFACVFLGWPSWVMLPTLLLFGGLFYAANDWLRNDKYIRSLDKSCETIQHTLDQRLRSLSECIKESLIELTQLRERGQYLSDANVEDDDHFEGMAGFFEMQKMLWLAKRSEYQELYLVDAVHKMRRTYFLLDRDGHGSAVLVTMLSLFFTAPAFYAMFNLKELPLLDVLLLALAPVSVVIAGWASYTYAGWNTGADTLRKKLDSSRWMTFAKLKIDAKLAGQYQRALGTIAKLNDQLAQKR